MTGDNWVQIMQAIFSDTCVCMFVCLCALYFAERQCSFRTMCQWSVLVPMVISILAVSAHDQPNMRVYLLKLDEHVKIIPEQAEVIQEYKNTTAALKKDLEEYKNITADLESQVETMKAQMANLTAARGEGKKGR